MAYRSLGPGRIYYGDFTGDPTATTPTTTNGIELGDIETFGFNPNVRSAYQTSANTGDVPNADSIRTLPPAAGAEVELYDSDIDKMVALVLGGAKVGTNGFGFGSVVKQVTPQTLIFVPDAEAASGFEAPHAIIMPGAIVDNLNDLRYGRITEGANNNPYTVRFLATRTATDQAGTAIPEAAQIAYIGPSASLGVSWKKQQ